jgi:hypothetical protein
VPKRRPKLAKGQFAIALNLESRQGIGVGVDGSEEVGVIAVGNGQEAVVRL